MKTKTYHAARYRRRKKQEKHEINPSQLKKLADFLEKNSLIRIWVRFNQSATLIALCIAVFGFILAVKKYDSDNKKTKEDRIAKSWDVVTKMAGKQSNGGQVNAINRLVAYSIPLDKIDLHNTFLAKANLKGASLKGANLSGADLSGADLRDADLEGADLSGATITLADLTNADLSMANLNDSKLVFSRIDLSIVMANSLHNTDITGSKIVFEDTEGGEKWEMFSDTLAEGRDADEMQALINQACSNTEFKQTQSPYLEVKLPTRNCNNALDYKHMLQSNSLPKGIDLSYNPKKPS